MGDKAPWRISLHIPFIIIVQAALLILLLLFTRYDPKLAYRNTGHGEKEETSNNIEESKHLIGKLYPMFQDVHVMIFIGFGFLMTFLKKYGLSAVSLNMLCSALAIQWSILVNGWLHPHCQDPSVSWSSCAGTWPYIDINVVSMISADFATAAVLISFGVVLGTTNPLQLLIMTLIEIVLFNLNEVIGRSYLGAVDAGDTIFVHMFGAYFGLAASRVLYDKSMTESDLAGPNNTSDLFSMVGTIFLWLFWPSFNSAVAADGDAQMRALINTYLSLCACVLAAFGTSALVNPGRKFGMDHIQNATLAGGVAVGATADMILTPGGAAIVGTLAGILSTCGYRYVTPFLCEKLKIVDTCGVNNLHGMPSILGGLLSVILAAIATEETYDKWSGNTDKSLTEIFPDMAKSDWGATSQALAQVYAILVTLGIAIIGGILTGLIMKVVGRLTAIPHTMLTEEMEQLNPEGQERDDSKLKIEDDSGERQPATTALSRAALYNDAAFFHCEA